MELNWTSTSKNHTHRFDLLSFVDSDTLSAISRFFDSFIFVSYFSRDSLIFVSYFSRDSLIFVSYFSRDSFSVFGSRFSVRRNLLSVRSLVALKEKKNNYFEFNQEKSYNEVQN